MLQWVPKGTRAADLGLDRCRRVGVRRLSSYGLLVVNVETVRSELQHGLPDVRGACAAIAIYCMIAFPQFEAPEPQLKQFILRRRYWLYYALQFMSGARRQIFVVFAAFMMVERFGFEVHQVTALFLINFVANMLHSRR